MSEYLAANWFPLLFAFMVGLGVAHYVYIAACDQYVRRDRRVIELLQANNREVERRREAEREASELNKLFDLQHSRSMEAIVLWRKAHPGNDLVQPDLGELLTWLLSHCTPRPESEWHEDFGPVLWLRFAEGEPPEVFAGTPLAIETWADFTAEDGYHAAPVWVQLPNHLVMKELANAAV